MENFTNKGNLDATRWFVLPCNFTSGLIHSPLHYNPNRGVVFLSYS